MKNKKIFLVSVIAIILSLIYTILINGITGGAISENNVITIESASCTWKETHFEVCEYLNWAQSQGYYVKGYIAGGESLDYSPAIYSSPATYCQDVGTLEGKRALHAYLYSSSGSLKALDVNSVVDCSKRKLVETTVKQKLQFRMQGDYTNRPTGSGVVKLAGFGGQPSQCIVTGNWKTDNDAMHKTRDYCDSAKGNFKGYADGGRQYVVNDAHPFSWQGISGLMTDPEEQIYQSYFIYMNTCDRLSFNKQRYNARARVTDFFDDGIELEWEYFNDDTKPAVDFDAIVECNIPLGEQPEQFVEQKPIVIEMEEKPAEMPQEEIKMPEIKEEQPKAEPKGLFYRLAIWIRSLFK